MFDLHTISFLLIFIAAGLVKGVTGMGLPTVAMGLLGLLMPPQAAAALLVLPSLLTNLWQLLAGPALAQIVRRLWLMMTGDYYWHVGRILTADRPQSSVVGAGAWRRIDSLCRVCALQSGVSGFRPRGEVAVAAHGRADRRYHRGDRVRPFPGYRRWAFRRDELVQALGLSFTLSTLALAAGLALHDGWHDDAWLLSALALLPALLGMWLGQRIRSRLSPQRFRQGFLLFLLALGIELIARGWLV